MIFLFAMNNEEKYYQINWNNELFTILNSNKNFNHRYITKNIKILSEDINYDKYHLYIILNSKFNDDVLISYNKCEKNNIEKKSIYLLIDLLTKVKCKLFGLDFI